MNNNETTTTSGDGSLDTFTGSEYSALGGKMGIEILLGLTELLQGYTVEVLWHWPPDLLKFAAEYFGCLRGAQDQQLWKAARGKGVIFDGDPMQTESNGEKEQRKAVDKESNSDFYTTDSTEEYQSVHLTQMKKTKGSSSQNR
uniref:Uncharacterized protein n=1 Tax=Sphaerodactylus townsendi TaxID=933632 RepID=A0ACB8GCD9_9SAUR